MTEQAGFILIYYVGFAGAGALVGVIIASILLLVSR